MSERPERARSTLFAAITAAVLAFGSAFPGVKLALTAFGAGPLALQGVSFIVQRPTVGRIGAVATTAIAIWIGTAVLALIYGSQTLTELSAASAPSIAAAIYVGLVSSVVGLACWAYVLNHIPASEASPYLLMVPVVATALSLVLLGDVPRSTTILGGIATVSGVLISTRRATVRPRPYAQDLAG
jgi:drug/metabolite transporter (DMT)-like permease